MVTRGNSGLVTNSPSWGVSRCPDFAAEYIEGWPWSGAFPDYSPFLDSVLPPTPVIIPFIIEKANGAEHAIAKMPPKPPFMGHNLSVLNRFHSLTFRPR